ncbi:hypothetical protein C8F01DRAFT_123986 [Mycena amicta]|nr:hypothetical protein C8F01DRAFT_123986 [Mycena amicta]
MPFFPIATLLPKIALSSRWELVDESSDAHNYLRASWAGASLSFHVRSVHDLSALHIQLTSGTERKDRWNGGTEMIGVTVSFYSSVDRFLRKETRTIEPFSTSRAQLVQLWPAEPNSDDSEASCEVRITLIDWASVLEIDGFIAEDESRIFLPATGNRSRTRKILFIGDSISCGLSLDDLVSPQLPFGVLDAYPYQAVASLNQLLSDIEVDAEVVAYPGISLCGDEGTNAQGMAEQFFCTSVWDRAPFKSVCSATFSIICIALGTNDTVSPSEFRRTLLELINQLCTHEGMQDVETIYVFHPFIDFTDPSPDPITQYLLANPVPSTLTIDKSIRIMTLSQEQLSKGVAREQTLDGLHPTVQGHALLGKNLADILLGELKNNL